ncbi:hypothetical protein GCM10007874_61520 [Labrys miyagiensis]|uniref:DUF2786 domain-containing protein n=1 Tax=Labrys miyagiensis TaxID=346912 RepID=A0ABQ6CS31_9HYPH|nr:DUF2786 domain-containing protein [Labrys miyagiensis]GLS23132.1 hypothetical protein GCM10007874_61520 [Labrys miyagiensis]
MPLDGARDDVEADFDILEALGARIDALAQGLVAGGQIMKTVFRWLAGHAEVPEDESVRSCLMAMAHDLELFTPSMSGSTMMDRYLRSAKATTDVDRAALRALATAQFHLVEIIGRQDEDLVSVKDVATGARLIILNSKIAAEAAGFFTAMRLCPLESGRHVLISPLFLMDEALLANARAFIKPGRPLGNGYRCAAALYREMARHGFLTMPLENDAFAAIAERLSNLREAERLALEWIALEDAADDVELIAEIRQAASLANLVDACGCFGQAEFGAPEGLADAYARIAAIWMETIARRAQAGVAGHSEVLDQAGAEIAAYIEHGQMQPGAGALFKRLRARLAFADAPGVKESGTADKSELDRAIQRIIGLRGKTVAQGCSEEEAMAAAAKVAELLARYDLSLDEVSVRRSEAIGVTMETGRSRRASIDDCVPPIAAFCDCRVWVQQGQDGSRHYIYFGLKVDVEAARFLHELIEATFEAESERFRHGEIYLGLYGGQRRTALNSFQVGLASGISGKLQAIREARQAKAVKSSGRDLVMLKHSVVDEEIDKLGLNFTTKTSRSRRAVHPPSYQVGEAAGRQFEPHPLIEA